LHRKVYLFSSTGGEKQKTDRVFSAVGEGKQEKKSADLERRSIKRTNGAL